MWVRGCQPPAAAAAPPPSRGGEPRPNFWGRWAAAGSCWGPPRPAGEAEGGAEAAARRGRGRAPAGGVRGQLAGRIPGGRAELRQRRHRPRGGGTGRGGDAAAAAAPARGQPPPPPTRFVVVRRRLLDPCPGRSRSVPHGLRLCLHTGLKGVLRQRWAGLSCRRRQERASLVFHVSRPFARCSSVPTLLTCAELRGIGVLTLRVCVCAPPSLLPRSPEEGSPCPPAARAAVGGRERVCGNALRRGRSHGPLPPNFNCGGRRSAAGPVCVRADRYSGGITAPSEAMAFFGQGRARAASRGESETEMSKQ